jgi:hypothetical protein
MGRGHGLLKETSENVSNVGPLIPSMDATRIKYLVKVKCSLEQATKAQRGSTDIALLFL